MSTRACVCFSNTARMSWEVYYKHHDGYPTGLGLELAKLLKKNATKDRIIRKLSLENYRRLIRSPEEAFTKIQGDLEWIYAIAINEKDPAWSAMRIYKTSNPAMDVGFVFPVWGCYAKLLPKNLKTTMEYVEMAVGVALNMLSAYREARR